MDLLDLVGLKSLWNREPASTLNYEIHTGHPQWVVGKGNGDRVEQEGGAPDR